MTLRLLIYAMESSGASSFCLVLGQLPDSVAVVDLWSHRLAPPLELDVPTVVKATATAFYSVDDHIRSFRPDRTILFLRDPVAVYSSLKTKPYANEIGTVEQKLARFDAEFGSVSFDLVLRYEDFVTQDPGLLAGVQKLGWPVTAAHYDFPRSTDEIRETNFRHSDWLREQYDLGWGFGNIHGTAIREETGRKAHPPEAREAVRQLAPRMTRFYDRFPR